MRTLVASLMLLCAVTGCQTASSPRYVFINLAPGVAWNQQDPASLTYSDFEAVRDAVQAPENPRLRVGLAFFFSTLQGDPDMLEKTLRAALDASVQTNTPILITLDGQQWWEDRPDLWNWWDPARPGYDPRNAHNVEWTSWAPADAVKIGWRNWGSQMRVAPAPNISSPAIIEAHLAPLRRLVPIIMEWHGTLPKEKRWLFGGIKLANEAGTGYNAFYYPNGNDLLGKPSAADPATGLDVAKGFPCGAAAIGYAAVRTAGIKREGELTPMDVGIATQRYLAALAREAHRLGVPRDKLIAHQGGTYAPWDKHLPFSAALNKWSVPGWSFYWTDPAQAGGLKEAVAQSKNDAWSAAEWWWGGKDREEWLDHLRRTMSAMNCRSIVIYNWDCGLVLRDDSAGREALRGFVEEY